MKRAKNTFVGPRVRVPRHEHSRPAGYLLNNEFASLAEVIDPKIPTRNLVELDAQQTRKLVVRRLQLAPESFQVAMIGIGLVDKHRAIAEVESDSRIGRYLIEIERYVLDALVSTVNSPRRRRTLR